MIRRGTWVALAVFALALAGAIWWDRSGRSFEPEETPTPPLEPLWELSASDIETLRLERLGQGEGAIVVARRDPEFAWLLEEPEAPYADVGRLERAVSSLLVPIPADTVESDDLGAFGLANPRYRVTFGLRNGTSRALEVGDDSPTGAVTYARKPGERQIYFLRSSSLRAMGSLLEQPPIATATAAPTETP
jgi:hypothetical protein